MCPKCRFAKRMLAFIFGLAISAISYGQSISTPNSAEVVCFRHSLKWAQESNFPNYFLIPEVRDSVFRDLEQNLRLRFGVAEVRLPKEIDYHTILYFGKFDRIFPETQSPCDYRVGIFSLLTRETTAYRMIWSMTIVVKQNDKIILQREARHELEYFNPSGYFTNQPWMTSMEFARLYGDLIREALGLNPSSQGKLVVGSLQAKEEEALVWLPDSSRYLLKMHGNWMNVVLGPGRVHRSFAAKLVRGEETVEQFAYKDGWPIIKIELPSPSGLIAELFTEATGLGVEYWDKCKFDEKGTVVYSDKRETKLRLRWSSEVLRTTTTDDVSPFTVEPIFGAIYREKSLSGGFVYTSLFDILKTEKTKITGFHGEYEDLILRRENTLGWGWTHRIEGILNETPFSAEYFEREGRIQITYGGNALAVMVVQNCNPENRSFGSMTLSKKKGSMSGGSHFGELSLANEEKLQWYPMFISNSGPDDKLDTCLEILTCLFFAIGQVHY